MPNFPKTDPQDAPSHPLDPPEAQMNWPPLPRDPAGSSADPEDPEPEEFVPAHWADPEDPLAEPLDPEFRNLGLESPPPDPFPSERERRRNCWRVQLHPHVPMPRPEVALVRRRMRLTQREFAHLFGFPLPTLKHWERGDRYPSGAALVLLNLIARHPRLALTTVARYHNFRRTEEAHRRRQRESPGPWASG
jgi:DNA-binding transcriptional regulator YiaG